MGSSSNESPQVRHRQAVVVWMTGLPGSGKTTLATRLRSILWDRGTPACLLDGDELRRDLCSDLGFSEADRRENVRRVGEIAGLLAANGIVPLVSLVSPCRDDRDRARSRVSRGHFIEVYVDCPVEICRERDPKGMYALAAQGLIPNFTGVSAPYEAPLCPEVHVATHRSTVDECAEDVLRAIAAALPPNLSRSSL